jgi:hypothetical protein
VNTRQHFNGPFEETDLSHIVSIKTEINCGESVSLACQRLQLPAPVEGTHRLYSGSHTGLGVQLPEWRYAVVCQLETRQLLYDNYNGRWGEQNRLDQFLQAYTVERAKLEARRHGHSVTESPLEDGSIKLTVAVNGGAA